MAYTTCWWRGAAIYHIYIRSFKDGNHDGIGDLRGCIEKLPYIASLGVDAVWISPFFVSPMNDFGYDIADYRNVDPLFGCLNDFDELVNKAHALDIKVVIDQVLSHTSYEHKWFKESRMNYANKKHDWYVWADANEDGGPPNNWLSIFGGCAWEWEPRRRQYYLHNFLKSQPDLNFHNPQVRAQILDEVKFWLDKGVDGLRLDAINFCFHDQKLRNNPAKPKHLRAGRGFSEDNPYAYQYHYYNNTQPEMLDFLKELRALTDRYPDCAMLGEISSEDSLKTMVEYTDGDDKLHMAYSFELLIDDLTAKHIQETVENFETASAAGWPCWAFSNHDVERVASRWKKKHASDMTNVLIYLLSLLRGSYCVYQGEELGLDQSELEFDQLVDPYGIAFWPNYKGRDGCRTPMPWESSQDQGGFSTQQPWLPLDKAHLDAAVDTQETDKHSTLNVFRDSVRLRKRSKAIRYGDISFYDAPEDTLLFERVYNNERIVVGVNLSAERKTLVIPSLLQFEQANLIELAGIPACELIMAETIPTRFSAQTLGGACSAPLTNVSAQVRLSPSSLFVAAL